MALIRKYKSLKQAEKISCLIVDEELAQIEAGYQEMQAAPPNEALMSKEELQQFRQSRIKKDLFNRTLKRILNVLKYNYLPDFNRKLI